MKQRSFSSWAIIGGIAIAGAAVYLVRQAFADPITSGNKDLAMTQSRGLDFPVEAPVVAKARNPRTNAIEEKLISSPKEGVDFINQNFGNLVSDGATLVKANTTFTANGNTYRTGSNQTVSRLADGQIKVLTVNEVKRDNKGLSEWDKRILKNKGLAATSANAAKLRYG